MPDFRISCLVINYFMCRRSVTISQKALTNEYSTSYILQFFSSMLAFCHDLLGGETIQELIAWLIVHKAHNTMLTIHRCTVLVDLPVDPFILRSLSQKKPPLSTAIRSVRWNYIFVYFIPKLSNLYWMPNSFSRGFGSAIRAVGYITTNQMILQKPVCECHVSFTLLWIEALS